MSVSLEPTARRISVNGAGEVQIMPDTAIIRLGVEVRDRDLAAAQSEASRRMTATINAVKETGIADSDLSTGHYNIRVNYDNMSPRNPIVGYTVTHTLTARSRDIEKVATVIKVGLQAGANQVNGVHFIVEDPGDAHSRAREAAIANAREKAKDLARITGTTISRVLTIDENSYAPQAVAADTRMYSRALMSESPMMADAPIDPGESTISVHVQVSWEII